MDTLKNIYENISRNTVVYGVFTLTSLLSPSVVLKYGPKKCLILASIPYSLYIIQLFFLNINYILSASVVLGVAAPVLWTSLGTFLTNNSDMRTVNRNCGVFWAMNQSSMFLGELK